MPDALPLFQKTSNWERRKPTIQRLYGGRFRVTRHLDCAQGSSVPAELFLSYGEPDKGNVSGISNLADLCLVSAGQVDAEGNDQTKMELRLIFETLTDVLVPEVAPVVDYDLNGLKRITYKLIALPGADLDGYDFDVGVSLDPINTDLVLAQYKDESDDAATRITLVYLQPGITFKGESAGPVPGTKRIVWRTWMLNASGSIPGVLTGAEDENWEGFLVRRFESVSGTITGTKQTYKDVVEVDVPGTVQLETVEVEVDDLSGTIAVPRVTPPRTKLVAATVTVEITTTPPNTASVAYDLGAISCSVTSMQAAYNYRGFDSMSTISGDLTESAPRRSASIGANIQTFPRCYLVGDTEVEGEFTYTAGTQFTRSSGGTIVSGTPLTSTETNLLVGTGATSASGYLTTGVLRRRSREVFQALNGTVYYEVITWTV